MSLPEAQPVAAKLRIVMVATMTSQLFAAAGLAATPLLGLHVSDVYALGVQIGNAAFSGIVVGVLYLIAIGRPWFNKWGRWSLIAAAFSLGLPAIVWVASEVTRDLAGSERDLLIRLLVTFGLGGAVLSLAGVIGVREACLGRPVPLASLTILPNFMLLVGVVTMAAFSQDASPSLPAVCWAIGCVLAYVAALRLRREGPPIEAGWDGREDNEGLHSVALAGGVVTSSVLPPLYLTSVSDLRDGAATALFLIVKIGSSIVGLTVNSALLVRYNWTSPRSLSGRFSAQLNLVASVLFVAGLMSHSLDLVKPSYALVVLGWLLTLIAAPLVMREVNARRLSGNVLTKTVVDLIVSVGVLLALFSNPSFTGFLAAFVMSQGVTTGIGGFGLQHRWLSLSSVPVVAAAAMLLLAGW